MPAGAAARPPLTSHLSRSAAQDPSGKPGRFATVDVLAEGAEGDPEFQRSLARLEDVAAHRSGFLLGAGAFDKGDQQFVIEREEQERRAEDARADREQRDFAAARARSEAEAEAARARGGAAAAAARAAEAARSVAERRSRPAVVRARPAGAAAAAAKRPRGGGGGGGGAAAAPAAEVPRPAEDADEEDAGGPSGLAGLLGDYGSDSDAAASGDDAVAAPPPPRPPAGKPALPSAADLLGP